MSNNSELKQLQIKIKKWDDKVDPLAKLDDFQLDIINQIEELNTKTSVKKVINLIFRLILIILMYFFRRRRLLSMKVTTRMKFQ